jgi:hypothetical protein
VIDPIAILKPDEREQVFAQCKLGPIALSDVLTAYLQTPADSRPDVTTQAGVIQLLQDMLQQPLLAEEARELGMENTPLVREKMQLNRNVLARMWLMDQLTERATARMNEPGLEERLRAWYTTHLNTRYTYMDDHGQARTVAFAR